MPDGSSLHPAPDRNKRFEHRPWRSDRIDHINMTKRESSLRSTEPTQPRTRISYDQPRSSPVSCAVVIVLSSLRQFFQTSLKTGIQRSNDFVVLLLPSIMRENSGASCGICRVPARWVLPLTLLPAHGTTHLHGHPFEHFITRGFGTLRPTTGRSRLGACGNTASIAASE